jgi:hypothetical protein
VVFVQAQPIQLICHKHTTAETQHWAAIHQCNVCIALWLHCTGQSSPKSSTQRVVQLRLCLRQRIWQRLHLAAARLRQRRLSATAAATQLGHAADQLATLPSAGTVPSTIALASPRRSPSLTAACCRDVASTPSRRATSSRAPPTSSACVRSSYAESRSKHTYCSCTCVAADTANHEPN